MLAESISDFFLNNFVVILDGILKFLELRLKVTVLLFLEKVALSHIFEVLLQVFILVSKLFTCLAETAKLGIHLLLLHLHLRFHFII